MKRNLLMSGLESRGAELARTSLSRSELLANLKLSQARRKRERAACAAHTKEKNPEVPKIGVRRLDALLLFSAA